MFSFERHIIQHKYSFLAATALLFIPAYSWKSFFSYWKCLQHEYDQKVLFKKRHNCVVTYQPNKGLAGWPPNVSRVRASGDKLFETLYEPILYFIRTAETTLDIAVMLINVNIIYSELITARRRGVKIRIIFNFHHTDSTKDHIKELMREGIECQFFVAPTSVLDTIMHNKYMIKDYSEESGFVCLGSMNFTATSILNNYESFVFMSNHSVVEAFQINFDECWQNISLDNEGLINKTILMDAQLDT